MDAFNDDENSVIYKRYTVKKIEVITKTLYSRNAFIPAYFLHYELLRNLIQFKAACLL